MSLSFKIIRFLRIPEDLVMLFTNTFRNKEITPLGPITNHHQQAGPCKPEFHAGHLVSPKDSR
jgi:hypothetical protein